MKSLRCLCVSALLAASASTLVHAQTRWLPYGPDGGDARAFALDPHDHMHVYLGTLTGTVFDSHDGGSTWKRVARLGSRDDLALENLYLSACSGIYRSVNEGGIGGSLIDGKSFEKVKGIPTESRRTRVLMQDPVTESTVYAGTTNGLWKTTNSGHTFTLHGDPNNIINDVSVDPQNTQHVLLATDRNGVLLSEDGGTTFKPANTGFSARQISAIAQVCPGSSRAPGWMARTSSRWARRRAARCWRGRGMVFTG